MPGRGSARPYAYLAAGTVYSRFRATSGLAPKPILVSTSSIALQNAVQGEYPPLLSGLLLGDAIHRGSGRRLILPDACALIVDEAHKLPETARQMFGVTLTVEDIRALTHSLRGERFLLAAEILNDSTAPLLRKLDRPPEGKPFDYYKRLLAAPERSLMVIDRQLHGLLTPATRRRLDSVSSTVSLFHQGHPDMVLYTEEDTHGGTMLCATISDLTAQLRQTLWQRGPHGRASTSPATACPC